MPTANCLLCGAELEYFQTPRKMNCAYCGKEYETVTACKAGHFICDACHMEQGVALILEQCKHTTSKNPIAIMQQIMAQPPTQIVEGQFSDGIKKNFTSQDFRFTIKGGKLYIIALKCSETGKYCVKSLGIRDASRVANFSGIIKKVEILGSDREPVWERDEEGLQISSDIRTDMPVVLRVTIE